MIDFETEHQVRTALHGYCETFDSADFGSFAGLFDQGRWFMVTEPGSQPVIDWINEHVVLYDGRPLTRHEMTNVVVESGKDDHEAQFRCYVAIWQHLPGAAPKLLTHVRFHGTFVRVEGNWRWREHVMVADWAGDLGTHIQGGLATVAT